MNNKAKLTIQSPFALLLLAVFVGTMLVKPVHTLLADHQHSDVIGTSQGGHAITSDHYKDCPVCDFEFCTFIPQKQIDILFISRIVRNEQALPTVGCLASVSTHLFQLRAPPVL